MHTVQSRKTSLDSLLSIHQLTSTRSDATSFKLKFQEWIDYGQSWLNFESDVLSASECTVQISRPMWCVEGWTLQAPSNEKQFIFALSAIMKNHCCLEKPCCITCFCMKKTMNNRVVNCVNENKHAQCACSNTVETSVAHKITFTK